MGRVADEDTRELERRWRQAPRDEDLARGLAAELRRIGRPLPRALVDALLEPARTFSCDVPLEVGLVDVDGCDRTLGTQPGPPIHIPRSRVWWVETPAADEKLLARVLDVVEREAVPGLRLGLGTGAVHHFERDLDTGRHPPSRSMGVFDDTAAKRLARCTHLRRLDLAHQPRLTHRGLESLHALRRLDTLVLCDLPDVGPRAVDLLTGWPDLSALYLTECPGLGGADLARGKPPAGLQHLHVDAPGEAAPSIRWAAQAPLSVLSVRADTWSKDDLAPLADRSALRVLNLDENAKFRGPGLGKLLSLERLSLARARPSGAGLKEVGKLVNLTRLDLHGAEVPKGSLAPLAALTRLEQLDLRDNGKLEAEDVLTLLPLVTRCALRALRMSAHLDQALGRRVKFPKPDRPVTPELLDLIARLDQLNPGRGDLFGGSVPDVLDPSDTPVPGWWT